MTTVDWIIVAGYLAVIVALGVSMKRRAGKNIEDFFISGRNLKWWLIGTSMVAAAFAADTPLFITSLVRRFGISGAWYYWNASLNGLLSAFLFASFWRRSLAVTDAEYREMRYSGKSGKLLRSVWAIYQGILCNCISMGWVILAMVKIAKVALDLPPQVTILGLTMNSSIALTAFVLGLVLIYAALSGLWGIVTVDFFQFFIALAGTIMLAVVSIQKIGGIEAMRQGIIAMPEAGSTFLRIIPAYGTTAMTFFIVGLCVQWWASPWVDGGIYVAQRTLAAKDERNAVLGRNWGNIAQMGIMVWPWVIVALCSIVMFPASENPDLAADPEMAYPKMVVTMLPTVFRGLMVAAFLAAFMSTMSTLLNSTSSYMVNDLYKRFLVRNMPAKHYVFMGRVCILLAAAISGVIAVASESILRLSMFIFEITAGVGMIFILRWLWWRINAWSELSSYGVGLIAAILVNIKFGQMLLMKIALFFAPAGRAAGIEDFFMNRISGFGGFPFRMTVLAIFSTTMCLLITLLTPPCETEHLVGFYKKIKLVGPGWRKIKKLAGPVELGPGQIPFRWSTVIAGAMLFYGIFFTLGRLPFGYYKSGLVGLVSAVAGGIYLWKKLSAYDTTRLEK
jgi:SSS family solute:Na+ symporter